MPLKTFLDGRVFADRVGPPDHAPHVLAMHGWARTRSDFAGVFDGVGALLVDLPGFGQSPGPESALGTTGQAATVAPLLAELTGPKVVVGHSYGGRVAVRMAADPQLAAGIDLLVLVGTPLLREPGTGRPAASYRAVRWLARRGLVPDSVLEKAREKHGSTDYKNAHGVLRDELVSCIQESYEEQLAAITVPTLVVGGEHDTAAPPAMLARATALLADGEHVVVPGAGHLIDPAIAAVLTERVRAVVAP